MAYRCHTIPACVVVSLFIICARFESNMATDWKKFKEAMKDKRINHDKGKNTPGKCILTREEIVVQRLSSDVSGKAQKYSRIGPREFVPYKYEEVTLENIKKSCSKYFASRMGKNICCDVLAGEQGPSCSSLDQIPDFKVVHIRFIEGQRIERNVQGSESPSPKKRRVTNQFPSSLPPQSKPSTSSRQAPKSLSVIDMLKLGKVINEKSTTLIDLYSFDIKQTAWSRSPLPVEFFVQKESLGKGGFREAFVATTDHPKFKKSKWVVKKYLPETLDIISKTGQTTEQHTKKVVQMHLLAKNFAEQLSQELKNNELLDNYGETLRYNQIFLGKIEHEEFVTVEQFVDGEFTKLINNDGSICEPCSELTEKAESLSHFSYCKSNNQLMVVDMQGSGYTLFDPEIASKELVYQGEYLFSTGNLTVAAISEFAEHHKCNTFCKYLGLEELKIPVHEID